MPAVGRFGIVMCALLVALTAEVMLAGTAGATLYPPPLRLALMFDREPWQPGVDLIMPVVPGRIIEKWER